MKVVDNLKEIADLIKKYNDQELYQRIVALREEVLGLKEENIEMRERLAENERKELLQSRLVRRGNCYYIEREGDEKDGPFCMACWDYEGKLVNVVINPYPGGSTFRCYICHGRKGKDKA